MGLLRICAKIRSLTFDLSLLLYFRIQYHLLFLKVHLQFLQSAFSLLYSVVMLMKHHFKKQVVLTYLLFTTIYQHDD